MIFGIPYTGILGKKPRKSLIHHHHFSMIFRFGIYGGSDPIYGDFDKKPGFLGKISEFWGKSVLFKNILLGAKFNRFFIILGGVQVWTAKTGKSTDLLPLFIVCDPQGIDYGPGRLRGSFEIDNFVYIYIIFFKFKLS